MLGLIVILLTAASPAGASLPPRLPAVGYHLTARTWLPLRVPPTEYLDRVEGVVRFTARHQDEHGAILDPFLHKEHQYATPYYAHALGTLLSAGRTKDLLESGIRAMEWSTISFQNNRTDGHRVFFIAPLVESLDFYAPFVPPRTLQTWRERLKTPVASKEAYDNNWTTYLMKGQWLKARSGLIEHDAAVDIIESRWLGSQRSRILGTPCNLYHDLTSSPDTLAVEVVGRANLLALVAAGYDGPSAAEIRRAVAAGTRFSLLLQDASGQMPCNGRTDDHVWGDVGYLLAYDLLAEHTWAAGDRREAGQYRHAAMLALRNIDRWRRSDGSWTGSYFVTKNHFDPALRVGYQSASQYSNYNGSLMHHLAQAWHVRRSEIPEQPAPAEIGGYAFALDEKFATAFANAGGMQMQIDLKGDTSLSSGNQDYWSALGIVRLGRMNWDTRLGPSDGGRNGSSGLGASFAPTFQEKGQWVRLASVPDRYEGRFTVQFVHPLLVRCAVEYAPRRGFSGPCFRHELVLTPDGVLCTLTRISGREPWGVTLPLLENDGTPLEVSFQSPAAIARTRYPGRDDQQNFIVLGGNVRLAPEPTVRSTYGDLRPVRATVGETATRIFVYPRSANDPAADQVRDSLRVTSSGFTSILGTVAGDLYIGRTAAGGFGDRIDLNRDGQADATFSEPCGFILQRNGGKIIAVETDRIVRATIKGRKLSLHAFSPVTID